MGVLNTAKNVLGFSCLACAVSLGGTTFLNKRMVSRFMDTEAEWGSLRSVTAPAAVTAEAAQAIAIAGGSGGGAGPGPTVGSTEERAWCVTERWCTVGGGRGSSGAGDASSDADVTVVFLPNIGVPSFEWWRIQQAVAQELKSASGRPAVSRRRARRGRRGNKRAEAAVDDDALSGAGSAARVRFLLYDRDGYGRSPLPERRQGASNGPSVGSRRSVEASGARTDDGSGPSIAAAHAVTLRALLADRNEPSVANEGRQRRLVLVGHGLGGLYAAVYGAMYADEVSNVVLVDPIPPPWEVPETHLKWLGQLARSQHMLAKCGAVRLLQASPKNGDRAAWGDDVAKLRNEHYARPDMYVAMTRETASLSADFQALALLQHRRVAGQPRLPPMRILYHAPEAMVQQLSTEGGGRLSDAEAVAVEQRWKAQVAAVYGAQRHVRGRQRTQWEVAEHGGHQMHVEEPQAVARTVAAAVADALDADRTQTRGDRYSA